MGDGGGMWKKTEKQGGAGRNVMAERHEGMKAEKAAGRRPAALSLGLRNL